MPLTENRSPVFALSLDADDVAAIGVLTANYSAEYGRKLSGVIEVTTRDRLHIAVSHDLTRFLAPNYLVRQPAGKRQNVSNTETSGQVSFEHLISSDLVLSFSRGMCEIPLRSCS